tara:strand:+ start:122 stop:427 length:306 start_codon:yes stop_codon:yes gene_type:complete
MAATKTKPTKLQQEQTRAAIKTTQLIKRLQGFALGENEAKAAKGEDPKPIEIDPTRLKAIEILLRKSLPDLSTVTLQGDDDKPLAFKSITLAPLVADAADD